ncbi:amidohydrolase/deacetylase family metallohydrolase [Oceanobacillus oncorhynchi]|uniref:amidohydrolase/deacetylase family metallohydrolase n=1 Tax=Oceanobacillus oncorhynchi TaxID=545501 RepID=UPI0034D78CFD
MVQVIKNALLTNGQKADILIENGRIKDVVADAGSFYPVLADAEGMYVSPGWIDLHTHAFPKYKPYCAVPDKIGYQTGVTTVVDAGSSGADTIEEFHQIAKAAKTRVLAFLNISRIGLKQMDELADINNISWNAIQNTAADYPFFIIGLKARMSASVVGDNGLKPLQLAVKYSKALRKPLMVHVGSAPPMLEEILPLLKKGDILTHCYHGKHANHILKPGGEVASALAEAVQRGIYLDVGHGKSSFSFSVAKKAMESGISFDTISTDIYEENQINGPVYSIAATLTKFLALGYSLEAVIRAVTEIPAQVLKQPKLGNFHRGSYAEFTFFTGEHQQKTLVDSMGNEIITNQVIKPQAVYLGNEYIELEKHYSYE